MSSLLDNVSGTPGGLVSARLTLRRMNKLMCFDGCDIKRILRDQIWDKNTRGLGGLRLQITCPSPGSVCSNTAGGVEFLDVRSYLAELMMVGGSTRVCELQLVWDPPLITTR